MPTEIRVPALGESVVEATVGQWYKQAGEAVSADEPLVELETDKVTVEVPAPASGVLSEIVVKSGDTVAVGALLGAISDGEGKAKPAKAKASKAAAPEPVMTEVVAEPAAPAPDVPLEPKKLEREPNPREEISGDEMPPSPAARKRLAESGLEAKEVTGSGRRGQVLKHDVPARAAEALLARERKPKPAPAPRAPVAQDDETREERVHMTRLRQTIARRLKEAQDTAAMLTTFNDVDMSGVLQLRRDYKDAFEKRHGVKLG
ncbi:MAG: biotin/lipoyl-containing protein, partial [Methyloceanibacter sp.]